MQSTFKLIVIILIVLILIAGAYRIYLIISNGQTISFQKPDYQKNSAIQANYGQRVSYLNFETISYPELTISYQGLRKVRARNYALGYFEHYEFKVSDKNESKIFSWAPGTGDVMPTIFVLSGKSYALELSRSDVYGSIPEGQMILTKK